MARYISKVNYITFDLIKPRIIYFFPGQSKAAELALYYELFHWSLIYLGKSFVF